MRKNRAHGALLRFKWPTTLLLACAFLLTACGGGGGGGSDSGGNGNPAPTYTYAVPADTGDGWAVGNLADEGFDVTLINEMMTRVVTGSFPNIDSVSIVRNDRLLLYWFDSRRTLDEYDAWIGNRDPAVHILHSTSKSFTSALVGIAIDLGFIGSTDTGFYSLFSYASYDNWDDRKNDMTVEDVLTMRLGMPWNEWTVSYTNPNNQLRQLVDHNTDWAKALLDLRITSDPGTVFAYNTAATTTLGQAVENATGMPLAAFADMYLFEPLGITAQWATTPTGLPVGGSGLFLTTRDLAKFGQLYLDGGVWQGQRLVSEDYVAASVTPWVDVSSIVAFNTGYGYQWWLGQLDFDGVPVDYWLTNGFGGQLMFVVPSFDLVVAFTSHNYDNNPGVANLYTMMETYVLNAMREFQ